MSGTREWLELCDRLRWGALGTVDGSGQPFVSGVAFTGGDGSRPGFFFHLSELALHTQHLMARPEASLLISEPDREGEGDPQRLRRLSLIGQARVMPRDSVEFEKGAAAYQDRFPESKIRFGFGDFHLFHFVPERGVYVGGFGAAEMIEGRTLTELLKG